jgi:phosphate transport system substrate-binding protein
MRITAVFCLIFILSSCLGKEKSKNQPEQAAEETTSYPVVDVNSVFVSSVHQGYSGSSLIDKEWTYWVSEGDGKGDYFTLSLSDSPGTVAGFAFKNGNGDSDLFIQYNRVKTFDVWVDGWPRETIEVRDSFGFEQYTFENPITGSNIMFDITDIYPGETNNNTCISEIVLFKRAVDDDELYQNIYFWLDNDKTITSVSDPEKLRLMDYMPFDISSHNGDSAIQIVSKIARLDAESTLKLNDNLPRLDGAIVSYPLYSSFVNAVYPGKGIDIDYDYIKKSSLENPNSFSIYDIYYTAHLNWEYFPSFNALKDWFWWYSRIKNDDANKFKSIVQCNNTSGAYQRLINGEADIIFCYEPSQEQIRAAAARGKRFNLTPIAKDAFVFIVNRRNILDDISVQQIKDIYSGRLTNWEDITDVNEPVLAYQRAENSAGQTILQSIMKGDRLMRSTGADYNNYNYAIGYTFLFYLNNMAKNSGTKVLSVNGISPDSGNLQSGKYPFTQTIYAVTTAYESENTRRFIEWILSEQGQTLVSKAGYTPVKN